MQISKKSLQPIEDFYIARGYRGSKLRQALAKDAEYQKLLVEKKQKLAKQLKVSSSEKKKYPLLIDADFEILSKCKQLEKLKLKREDKLLVKIIKSQLEHEWRTNLLDALNRLHNNYMKGKKSSKKNR